MTTGTNIAEDFSQGNELLTRSSTVRRLARAKNKKKNPVSPRDSSVLNVRLEKRVVSAAISCQREVVVYILY